MSNTDKLDEVLEGISQGSYSSTSIADFDKIAKEATNESLADMAKSQNYKVNTNTVKSVSTATNRYEYFMISLDNVRYSNKLSVGYRQGHEAAMDRYIGKVELNKNNLGIVDKVIKQELLEAGNEGINLGRQFTSATVRRGYYEGLQMVQDLLNRSKKAMMKKASTQVLDALNK